MARGGYETTAAAAATPAAQKAIRRLGAAPRALSPAPPPDPDALLDVALEGLRFEHAHAEASRSRAAGLLTAFVHRLGI